MTSPRLLIELPPWVDAFVDWRRRYGSVEDRMAMVIDLGHEQIRRGTGGPFAAAVFERDSGALIAVGVNLAVPSHNCALHAEVVALMMAGARLHSHNLGAEGMAAHDLGLVLRTLCDVSRRHRLERSRAARDGRHQGRRRVHRLR